MARGIRSPRSRIASGALASLTGLALLSLPAFAAASGPGHEDGAPAAASWRRSRETDDLRRKDLVAALAARGVTARPTQSLAELVDWRERIDAARALAAQVGLEVDWRMLSLGALTDMRLRAAKAAELRANFGIGVDWRRYTWADLERLRLSLTALHPAGPVAPGPATTAWDADALAPFDPNRHLVRPRPAVHDPDAIFEPVFASEGGRNAFARDRKSRRFHPDAVLAPTFGKAPLRSGEPDDLIDPWGTR